MADVCIPMGARIVAGSYAGNGAASQIISTGGTPKAVLLRSDFRLSADTPTYGIPCLCVKGVDAAVNSGNNKIVIAKIVAGGFEVYSVGNAQSNLSGYPYTYIAFL